MNQTVVRALVWESLTRTGWGMLSMLALCFSFLPMFAIVASVASSGFEEGGQFQLGLELSPLPAIFVVLLILAAGLGTWPVSRLYTKPLSNTAIAVWQIVWGGLLLSLSLPLVLWSYEFVFGAGWPIASTWLFAIGLWIVAQPFFLVGTRSFQQLFITGGPILLMALWYLVNQGWTTEEQVPWEGFRGIEVVAMAGVIVVFAWMTQRAVAADRCGESRRSAWIGSAISTWIEQIDARGSVLRRPFRSPWSAQVWYHWRLRGWGLPLGMSLLLLIIFVGSALPNASLLIAADELLSALPGLATGFAMVCGVYGFVLGMDLDKWLYAGQRKESSKSFEQADRIGGFIGSKPVEDGLLARAQLTVCAISLLITMMIFVTVFYTLASLTTTFSPFLALGLPWQWLPLTLAGWWIAASATMTMTSTGRTKQWAIGLVLLVALPTLIGSIASIWMSPASVRMVQWLVFWLIATTISLVTIGCYAIALWRGHLRWWTALLALVLFAVGVASALAIPGADSIENWMLSVCGAALCLLPIAAMPLAVAMNRHR